MPNIKHIRRKCLYKYMTLSNAKTMLQNDTLYFSNPECWDDPLESYVLNRKFVTPTGKWDYPLKNRLGICCFTQNSANEAQWKVYSNPHNDIMVQITFDFTKLLSIIKNYTISNPHIINNEIYCDEVEYVNRDRFRERNKKILTNARFKTAFNEVYLNNNSHMIELLRPFILKSSSYSYENEMRFIVVFDDYLCPKGYSLKIKGLKNAISKISISSMDERNCNLNKIKADLQKQMSSSNISICINSTFHRPSKLLNIKF